MDINTSIPTAPFGATPAQWDEAIALFGEFSLLPCVQNPAAEVDPSCGMSATQLALYPSWYNITTNKADVFPDWESGPVPGIVEELKDESDYGILLRAGINTLLMVVEGPDELHTTITRIFTQATGFLPHTFRRPGGKRVAYLIRTTEGFATVTIKLNSEQFPGARVKVFGEGEFFPLYGCIKPGDPILWDGEDCLFGDMPLCDRYHIGAIFTGLHKAFPQLQMFNRGQALPRRALMAEYYEWTGEEMDGDDHE